MDFSITACFGSSVSAGEQESEGQVNDPCNEMPNWPQRTRPKTWLETTFPFKSSLKGTPDDSRTMFDTVVMPAAVSPDSRASESPCCAVVFNLMHFNIEGHSNFSCNVQKFTWWQNIKPIQLKLPVCPWKRLQNTNKFPSFSFRDLLRLSVAFTDSCNIRTIHWVAPQAPKY